MVPAFPNFVEGYKVRFLQDEGMTPQQG